MLVEFGCQSYENLGCTSLLPLRCKTHRLEQFILVYGKSFLIKLFLKQILKLNVNETRRASRFDFHRRIFLLNVFGDGRCLLPLATFSIVRSEQFSLAKLDKYVFDGHDPY